MALDLFTLAKGISGKDCHSKFLTLINNRITLSNEMTILSDWTKDFVDRDNKIVKEFQTTFHSSFWEIYLNAYMRESKYSIDTTHNRPDFLVEKPCRMGIEAVVANIKQNGIPESQRTFEDQLSMLAPPWLQVDFVTFLDESIVRYSSAISSKLAKYKKEYLNFDWIDQSMPFVIAMASYDQINYGREYIYSMMALLYGFYYDPEIRGYTYKGKIKKPGTDSDITLNVFSMIEFNEVSAVIFSCTTTIGKLTSLSISRGYPSLNQVFAVRENLSEDQPHFQLQVVSKDNPEMLSDGLFVFHNPNASNPIEVEAFPNATHFFNEDGDIKISGLITPLIARFNTSNIFVPTAIPLIQEQLRSYNNATVEDFYK